MNTICRILFLFFAFVFLTSCMFFKKSSSVEKPKVIIVGGGIAGMAAAKKLQSANIEVLVLEAQSKLGGRLKTDRSNQIIFDEGASWIHGPDDNPLTPLLKPSGIITQFTDDENIIVYNNKGEVYKENLLLKEEEKYDKILDDIRGAKNKSIKKYLEEEYPEYSNDVLWQYMLSAYLEFDTGADIEKLSSKYFYDDKAFKGNDIIVTNGYDKLIDFLSNGIQVKLDSRVNKIDYSKDKICVQTDQNEYYADYVLVTVPLGVLKKKQIQFIPPLKSKTKKAIDYLKMGSVNKFLCVWDSVFWDESKQYIGYTSDVKGKFNYFLNVSKLDSKHKALMTFTFGEYSRDTEKLTDVEVQEEIMSHLRQIYGDSIPDPKIVKRTKWNSNPYSYGSYSFVGLGGKSSYYRKFNQPKVTHLFFAGEHTSKDYRGTVHGAYLTGEREAEEIINIVK